MSARLYAPSYLPTLFDARSPGSSLLAILHGRAASVPKPVEQADQSNRHGPVRPDHLARHETDPDEPNHDPVENVDPAGPRR